MAGSSRAIVPGASVAVDRSAGSWNDPAMLVSAAICTFQRYDSLARSIESLRRQSLAAAEYEILVIDNAPDAAASAREARAWRRLRRLRWIHAAEPGLAHARNRAIEQARAPVLAFLDDDALASRDWLAAILAGFAELGEAVHIVGGPVRPLWMAPRPVWLADGLLPYLSLLERGRRLRVLGPDEWVAGTNVAYRLGPLRAAGGFSTSLGRVGAHVLLSNEETALERRMHAAGGRTGWVPKAAVRHCIDPSRLDRRWFRRRAAWQAVSDFMQHSGHFIQDSRASWEEAERFFAYAGGMNAVHALARDQQEPAMFHWEVSAIYHLTLCLLGGLQPPA